MKQMPTNRKKITVTFVIDNAMFDKHTDLNFFQVEVRDLMEKYLGTRKGLIVMVKK